MTSKKTTIKNDVETYEILWNILESINCYLKKKENNKLTKKHTFIWKGTK